MKQLFVPTLAALVAGAVTFAYVSTQKEKETTNLLQAQELAWNKDKADLEAALAEARKRTPIIRTVISTGVAETGGSALSAEEILESSRKYRSATGIRNRCGG